MQAAVLLWRVALLTGALAGGGAQALTPADVASLRRGEIVTRIIADDGPGGRVEAAIDIAAPVGRVWRVMIDCARAPSFVPKLEACRILESARDGASDLREHRVRFIPVLPRLTLRFRSFYQIEREIRFVREGGDLSMMEGVWRFEPIEQGRATRLHYAVRLATRFPLPRGMVRDALARDTPHVLRAVRQEVLRGG